MHKSIAQYKDTNQQEQNLTQAYWLFFRHIYNNDKFKISSIIKKGILGSYIKYFYNLYGLI